MKSCIRIIGVTVFPVSERINFMDQHPFAARTIAVENAAAHLRKGLGKSFSYWEERWRHDECYCANN
jgi:hypothetical protein